MSQHSPESIYRVGNVLELIPLDGNAQTKSLPLKLKIVGHKQIGWDFWSQVVEAKVTGPVPQNLKVPTEENVVVKAYDSRCSMKEQYVKQCGENEIKAYKIFKGTQGIEGTHVAVSYGSYTLSKTETPEPIMVLLLQNLVGDPVATIINTVTSTERADIVRNMNAALQALIKVRVFPLDVSLWNFIRLKGGTAIRVVDFGIVYILSVQNKESEEVLSRRVLGDLAELVE